MTEERELLIFASEDCLQADMEADVLREMGCKVTYVRVAAEEPASGGGMIGKMRRLIANRRCVDSLRARITPSVCGVLVYGGDEACGAAYGAARTAIPVIERRRLTIGPVTAAVGCARHHKVEEHALTFISVNEPERTAVLMRDMALARTGSQIIWQPLHEAGPLGMRLPENLHIEPAGSVEESVGRGAVDWFIDMSEKSGEENVRWGALHQALSAGVPFAAVDSPLLEDAAMSGCGITFLGFPEKEEFIGGLLPYIDSDERMDGMRNEAREYWKSNHSAEGGAALLIKEINQKIAQG